MKRILGEPRLNSPHTGRLKTPLTNGNKARNWMQKARASALKAYRMTEFSNPLKK